MNYIMYTYPMQYHHIQRHATPSVPHGASVCSVAKPAELTPSVSADSCQNIYQPRTERIQLMMG